MEEYERLVNVAKQKEISFIENQIESLRNHIKRINEENPIVYECCWSLQSEEDRIKILEDMKEKFTPKSYENHTSNIFALFANVDKIRYAYSQEKIECPQWYLLKYKNFLKQ